MEILDRELERLKSKAEEALRAGDLAGAAEVKYGEIPQIEALKELSRLSVVHRSSRLLVMQDGDEVWIAKRLGDVHERHSAPEPEPSFSGWMKVDAALTLKERKQLILQQVHAALDRGDHVGAGRLETGALRLVERAMRLSRTFEFVSSEGDRTILRDEHNQLHVLVPIEDA